MKRAARFQDVLDAISFRIKGEKTWVRLADYYEEDKSKRDAYRLIGCPQCGTRLKGDHCPKCGVSWKGAK